MSSLTSLNLSYNEVTYQVAAHIAKLQKLIILDISGNLIEDAGVAHLAQLKKMNITANSIGPTGKASVK
jgi:Leucine-rich repeat (LRR) protein